MLRDDLPRWLLPCAPVLAGTSIMVGSNAPVARWGVHVAAGALGLAAYLTVTRVQRQLPWIAALWGAVATVSVVAATLAATGIDGVQRWYEVGPLLVHPSALVTPALLVFFAETQARRPFVAYGLLMVLQVAHFLQPDAGQATALGLGAATIAVGGLRGWLRAVLAGSSLVSVVPAWFCHDPLPPVAFVEDIVLRAFALAPAVGVTALASLALLLLAPLVGKHSRASQRGAPAGLAAYFAGSLIATYFGEFPVPLLGFGSSPLVGAFLGLAALQRLATRPVEGREGSGATRRSTKDSGFTSWCSAHHEHQWMRRSARRTPNRGPDPVGADARKTSRAGLNPQVGALAR